MDRCDNKVLCGQFMSRKSGMKNKERGKLQKTELLKNNTEIR